MTLFNKLEIKRIEIDDLRKRIHSQNNYIKNYRKNDDFLVRFKEKKKVNETELQKLLADFNYFVLTTTENNETEFILWINFHKDIIKSIENFSNFINQKREYSEKRRNYVKNIKTAWDNFFTDKKLPDTFLGEDYKLFCDLKKAGINNLNKLSVIYNNEISELEKHRQELTILSKQLFQMDTIIDKGTSWGASNEAIDKAYEDIKIVDKENREKETYLNSLIEKIFNKNPEIIEEWQLLHLYTCISIIDFAYTADASRIENDSTRLFVTDETFYLWKNVLNEKMKFIIPNTYFLSDYDTFFNKVLEL